jgi:hypothetical protein
MFPRLFTLTSFIGCVHSYVLYHKEMVDFCTVTKCTQASILAGEKNYIFIYTSIRFMPLHIYLLFLFSLLVSSSLISSLVTCISYGPCKVLDAMLNIKSPIMNKYSLISYKKHNRPLWVAVQGPNRPTPYTYIQYLTNYNTTHLIYYYHVLFTYMRIIFRVNEKFFQKCIGKLFAFQPEIISLVLKCVSIVI